MNTPEKGPILWVRYLFNFCIVLINRLVNKQNSKIIIKKYLDSWCILIINTNDIIKMYLIHSNRNINYYKELNKDIKPFEITYAFELSFIHSYNKPNPPWF